MNSGCSVRKVFAVVGTVCVLAATAWAQPAQSGKKSEKANPAMDVRASAPASTKQYPSKAQPVVTKKVPTQAQNQPNTVDIDELQRAKLRAERRRVRNGGQPLPPSGFNPRGVNGADACGLAPDITEGVHPFDNSNATTDGASSCGFQGGLGHYDLWWRYVPSATGTATMNTCAQTGLDTQISAHSSCGGTELGCNDDACALQSSFSFQVSQGVAVWLRVASWSDAARGSGTFTISLGGGGGGNDECANATPIGEGTFNFDTTSATTDLPGSCGGMGSNVWYEYIAGSTGAAQVTTCGLTSMDSVLAVFDGCGGNEIVCLDDFCGLQTTITFAVTQGQHYWLTLGGFVAQTGTGQFTVSVSEPAGNDNCADAVPIGEGTYDINTLGATTDGPDEPGLCFFFGDSNVNQDIWHLYTAGATGACTVSLCGSGFDTKVAIYSGSTCPTGESAIACNDDACGLQSELSFLVTQGQQFLVRVGGYGGASGIGTMTLSVSDPVANDFCDDATAIGEGTFDYDTNAATSDNPGNCGAAGNNVWFVYSPSMDGRATVTTCGLTGHDTVLAIFDACNGSQILCLDDFCDFQTQVRFPVLQGTLYYISIGGFAGGRGAGQFNVSVSEPCSISIPGDAINVDDACDSNTIPPVAGVNDGCNYTPATYSQADVGNTYTGTVWGASDWRDLDWYRFDVTVPSTITLRATSETTVRIWLGDGDCGVTQTAAADECTEATLTADFQPGTYSFIISTDQDFSNYPCGTSNDYVAVLEGPTQDPAGGCCTANGCSIMTQAGCQAAGGRYLGDDTDCGAPTSTLGCAGDDCFSDASMGFDFTYYGNTYNTISVASNGYCQFGGGSSIFTNQPIPTPGFPDNILCPLWDDWMTVGGGTVRYETRGTAPNRRFIVQWTDVPSFSGCGTSHGFQLALFEGTNEIQFRYNGFTTCFDSSVGLENVDGTVGTAVDANSIGQNACISFSPPAYAASACSDNSFEDISVASSGPCDCPVDWDGDGFVTGLDFDLFVLDFEAGNADYNGDGFTNGLDFDEFVADFEAGCD